MSDTPHLHLDDDTLSAIIDGEEPPSTHLDACAECRARSNELQFAARLVGESVPLPGPDRRTATIAAAVDAYEPRRVRRLPAPSTLVAAAAIIAIIVALPLVLTRGDSNDGQSADVDRDAPAGARSSPSDAATMAMSVTVQAGDLGTLAEGTALRPLVLDALERGAREAAPAEGPFACDETVRAMDRDATELALVGQATVNGRAGHVLVYRVPGDPPKLHAHVVAKDDCASILLFASFNAP